MREQVAVLADFLNVPTFIHFPFFVFGTLVKKHYDAFRSITDNGRFMAIVLLLFFGSVLFKDDVFSILQISCNATVEMFANKIEHLITGLLGIVVVFTFFRKKESIFAQATRLGRSLQYIGRRTLDVYLLHYFFLPSNLAVFGTFFNQNVNPTIEFFVSLLIATMVLCLSLCMSNILRLSSVLEHYLFGVKTKD